MSLTKEKLDKLNNIIIISSRNRDWMPNEIQAEIEFIKEHDKEGALLYEAINHECTEISKFLLENQTDLNVTGKNGHKLLSLAVEKRNIYAVRSLIDKGVDIKTYKDAKGNNFLHNFINIEEDEIDEEIIKALLEKLNIDATNNEGRTALHKAILLKRKNKVKILIKLGANVNLLDKYSSTPLEYCFNGIFLDEMSHTVEKEIIEALLEKIENKKQYLDKKDDFTGQTILHRLFQPGSEIDIKWAIFLMKHGADPKIEDFEGKSFLDYLNADQRKKVEKIIEVTEEKLKKLKELIDSSESESVMLPKIQAGIEFIKEHDKEGTLFNKAMKNRHTDIIIFLLQNQTDLTISPNNLVELLHYAVEKNNMSLVKLLLDRGADINGKGKIIIGPGEFVTSTALYKAVEMNHIDIAIFLINQGADIIKSTNSKGKSVLHRAIDIRNIDLIKALLSKITDISYINNIDQYGSTLLHYAVIHASPTAAQKATPEMVEILLEYGADVNKEDKCGWNPLVVHIVNILMNDDEIVKILLKKVENKIEYLNKKDKKTGSTILHYAAQKPRASIKIMKLLIENGANPYIIDNEGKSFLDCLPISLRKEVEEFIKNMEGTEENAKISQGKPNSVNQEKVIESQVETPIPQLVAKPQVGKLASQAATESGTNLPTPQLQVVTEPKAEIPTPKDNEDKNGKSKNILIIRLIAIKTIIMSMISYLKFYFIKNIFGKFRGTSPKSESSSTISPDTIIPSQSSTKSSIKPPTRLSKKSTKD